MSREFRSRDKKVQKMSRDGLVEKNLATGEQERISSRGQDFNLRQEQQQGSPLVRESPQAHSRRQAPPEAFSQNQDLPQSRITEGTPPPDTLAFSMPEAQAAEAGVSETTLHVSVSRQYRVTQAETAEPLSDSKASAESRFAERDPLHLKTDSELPASAPKRKQKGTKYQQQFAAESAEATKNEQADFSPTSDSASAETAPTAEPVPAEALPDSPKSPQSSKASRLQFSKNEAAAAPAAGAKPDKKLERSRYKAEDTKAKLDAAREKIPKKKVKKRVRLYDEETKKAGSKMQFEEVPLARGEKRFNPPAVVKAPVSAVKSTAKAAGGFAYNKFHEKVSEVEHENVGIQTAHLGEKAGEAAFRGGKRVTRSVYRFVKDSPYRAVEKLEKQAMKANVKYSYRKALAENPNLKSNFLSRYMQKKKIQRQYAKAYRDAKKAGQAVKKTGSVLGNAGKAVGNFVRKHPAIAGIVALILFLFCFLSSILSSCSNMATGMLSSVVGSSYLAEDSDINNASLIYTEWETDLQIQINNAASDNPGYDEYRYNVADIGHDPFELMAYLTAVYQDFTYAQAEAALRQIFAEQYNLSLVPEVEIRTRTETRTDTYTDPDTGETYTDTYEVEVEYEWHILNINLSAQSFSNVIYPRMNTDQREMFELYMQTKGNRQYISNPFNFNWLPNVTSYYGWRVHPISGEKNNHRGIDIGVPIGTDIMAGMDGVVVSTGYDAGGYGYYIVVENDKGVQARFAHCDSILAVVGQEVTKETVIAKSGNTGNSTGPHLHLEVIKDGEYLNPLYFAETGDDGSGRIPPGAPGGITFPEYSGEPVNAADFAAMMAEAERHLGKRYVFGANGPDNFDCSSFVCWVLDRSGVYPMSRTTAQGLFNISTPVSPADARPGDLIFFHSTYSTASTVTHVGIYTGSGMIHAGDPIQYTTIDSTYWQNHFYAFGRISN